MALGKAKNVVDLERTGDALWVDLTRDILAADGLYRRQPGALKGIRWPTATSLSCW